jgi:ATP-dependent Clp protease ATP-binding subunit ClpA
LPFLNDMLAETARRRGDADALTAENNACEDVLSRHMAEEGLKTRFQFDIRLIEKELRGQIVGQDEAVGLVGNMLKLVRADIGDPRRPLSTALFLGPTGVGKTELVRALARAMHGDADAVCRIDMNTLSQEHYAAALTGAPPGYVGSKEGTTILDQEKIEGRHGRPGIVLFDELEKASPEVVLALLNVFDNGTLTVASGERTYSFRNALVFMTSNLGSRKLQALETGRFAALRRLIQGRGRSPAAMRRNIAEQALLASFPPEFVNRIDHIQVFNAIEADQMEALVEIELARLNRRLAKHHCILTLDGPVMAHLAQGGFDRKFGARALRRFLRNRLEVPFAHYLIESYTSNEAACRPRTLMARWDGLSISFSEMKPSGRSA